MPLPRSLVDLWCGRQADLWSTDGTQIRQPGGYLLPGLFDLPLCSPGDPVDPGWQSQPQIETFEVDPATDRCAAMGQGRAIDWWEAAAQRLATTVQGALRSAGVALAGPATITASVTSLGDVNAEPHMDDALYQPEAGPGVVAIAGTGAGPRALVGSVAVASGRSLADLSQELVGWFDGTGTEDDLGSDPERASVLRLEHYPANRISLFTRFGQVHAGPGPDDLRATDAFALRSLLVYRAATVPGTAPT